MRNTMELLDKALERAPAAYWTKQLALSKNGLYTSREREHLSPAIAGCLADLLGEDVEQWVMIAALESERDSACKTTLLKRMKNRVKRSFYVAKQRAKDWAVSLQKSVPRSLLQEDRTRNSVRMNVVNTRQFGLFPTP